MWKLSSSAFHLANLSDSFREGSVKLVRQKVKRKVRRSEGGQKVRRAEGGQKVGEKVRRL